MARTIAGPENTQEISNFIVEKRLNTIYISWNYEKPIDFGHFLITIRENDNVVSQTTDSYSFLYQTTNLCILDVIPVSRYGVYGPSKSTGLVKPLASDILSLDEYIPEEPKAIELYFDVNQLKYRLQGSGFNIHYFPSPSANGTTTIYISTSSEQAGTDSGSITNVATGKYYSIQYVSYGEYLAISNSEPNNYSTSNTIPIYLGNTLIFNTSVSYGTRHMVNVFYGDRSNASQVVADIPDPLTIGTLYVGNLIVTGTHNIDVKAYYERQNPTEITVGGIQEGTILNTDGTTVQDVLDLMLFNNNSKSITNSLEDTLLLYGVHNTDDIAAFTLNIQYKDPDSSVTSLAIDAEYYYKDATVNTTEATELTVYLDGQGGTITGSNVSIDIAPYVYDGASYINTRNFISKYSSAERSYSLNINLVDTNTTYTTSVTWVLPLYSFISNTEDYESFDNTNVGDKVLSLTDFGNYDFTIPTGDNYLYFLFPTAVDTSIYYFFDRKTGFQFDFTFIGTYEYNYASLTDATSYLASQTVTYSIFRSTYKQPPGTYAIEVREIQ